MSRDVARRGAVVPAKRRGAGATVARRGAVVPAERPGAGVPGAANGAQVRVACDRASARSQARRWAQSFLLFAAAGVGACGGSPQELVEVSLQAAGTEPEVVVLEDGTELVAARAKLAFGPFYLCPGNTAGELCSTARAEWLGSGVIDCLDADAQVLGVMNGASGSVRSYMYDVGFSSILTAEQPVVAEAAEELGGASLVLEGTATLNASGAAVVVPFYASVIVQQAEGTEQGQPVVRKSTSESFSHELTADDRLTVTFTTQPWLSSLSTSTFWQDANCPGDGNSDAIVCAGTMAQDCASGETTDCSGANQICAPDVGCADVVTIEEGSAAYRQLQQAIAAGARPEFSWD